MEFPETLSLTGDLGMAELYEGIPAQLCHARRESMASGPPQVEIGVS